MSTLAIIGLPGTGKTTLALALAASRPRTLVLHTDLLKVTLRHLDRFPRGPSWQGHLGERLDAIRPVLAAHVLKARSDRYDLVVEGVLALACDADVVVRLEAPEPVRATRNAAKHRAAASVLAHADLTTVAEAIAGARVHQTLDATLAIPDLVAILASA